MRVVVWAAFMCLVLTASARAASFDCAKASTFVEKAICSDKQLSSLDAQLAALYKAARAATPDTSTLETDGEAMVQQTNGKIKFSINAAYRQNTGEVSGEIPLTGDSAKYVDQNLDYVLSFKFTAGKLAVTQDGSRGMGLNVSGAGTYKRVSNAPPKFEE